MTVADSIKSGVAVPTGNHSCVLDKPSPKTTGTPTRLLLFHEARTYPVLESLARMWMPAPVGRLASKLGLALEYHRNPRSMEYMLQLAQRHLPDLDSATPMVVSSDRDLATIDWTQIRDVIVLWPDANGTGWTPIERCLFGRGAGSVLVLNGRGRMFPLTRRSWRAFQIKRAVAKSFIPEIIVLSAFLVTSPILALWDLRLRGGR